MTLYYTIVFALLMLEMAYFMFLIVPLPHTARRSILSFISTNKIVAQIQYWLKITFIFILVLFIDSVNRVYRVQVELSETMERAAQSGGTVVLGHERTEVQARKFYAQRNMYLCGFTLFLSLILNRTYVMIKDIIRLEEKVRAFDGKSSSSSSSSPETAALRKELAKKEQDLQTLKKQSEQLHKSYNDLCDKVDQSQPGEAKKTK